jgi:hypothetical protein
VLLQLACDWLRAERIVRPPVDALTRRVATARDGARAEACHRLAPLPQPPRPMQLDGLLNVDPGLGITRLASLGRGASAATLEVLKAELAKLEFLRRHGADQLDLSRLPAGRQRMLAEVGRRQKGSTPAIARRGTERGSGLGVSRWVVEQSLALLHSLVPAAAHPLGDPRRHPRGLPQPRLRHHLLAPIAKPLTLLGALSASPTCRGR